MLGPGCPYKELMEENSVCSVALVLVLLSFWAVVYCTPRSWTSHKLRLFLQPRGEKLFKKIWSKKFVFRFNHKYAVCLSNTWVSIHGGDVVLVVLVWGQLTRADRGVKRMGVGNKVWVSQIGRQVVCGGQSWWVGRRVALWRLGGDHHPADPRGVLQHLWGQRERKERRGLMTKQVGISLIHSHSPHTWRQNKD